MRLQRYGVLGGVGVLALALTSACGTNNNGGGGSAASAKASGDITCADGTLSLHGSTAQQNAISQWTKDYQSACSGATINYNADGSGAGYTAFVNKQADFAGSDYAMSATQLPAANKRCAPATAVNLPLVPGAIAVMYNVPGLSGSHLKLSAQVLGEIYAGQITSWNNAAIAKDNPGLKLPNLPIQTFHRSDPSGTSYNFSNYLHSIAPKAWTSAANKQWPSTHGQGEKGSAAVAQAVKSTSGGIGYAEYSYATQSGLPTADVGNAAGQFVSITQSNAENFIAKASVAQNGASAQLNFNYNYASPDAYPAVLVTYEFVCSNNTGAKGKLIKDFLSYMASDSAQKELDSLGYVPLPSGVDTQMQSAIAKITAN